MSRREWDKEEWDAIVDIVDAELGHEEPIYFLHLWQYLRDEGFDVDYEDVRDAIEDAYSDDAG